MTTAGDIKAALHRRYNKPSQGREGEHYICLEEARSGAGYDGNGGQCDFLAINAWPSRGIELIGHEIKVSLGDWKKELATPEKAEVFARFCKRWYVVVPTDLAAKMGHEVPPAWGLLVMSDKGRLTERQKPTPRRDITAVPPWWWIGWLAQIDRQHKRTIPRRVDEAMRAERQEAERQIEERVERRLAQRTRHADERSQHLQAVVAKFAEHRIDLEHVYLSDVSKMARLWSTARTGLDLDLVVTHLRQAADKLEEAAATTRAPSEGEGSP